MSSHGIRHFSPTNMGAEGHGTLWLEELFLWNSIEAFETATTRTKISSSLYTSVIFGHSMSAYLHNMDGFGLRVTNIAVITITSPHNPMFLVFFVLLVNILSVYSDEKCCTSCDIYPGTQKYFSIAKVLSHTIQIKDTTNYS